MRFNIIPVSSNFYPRSPCGERLGTATALKTSRISIHALLAESDIRVDKIPNQGKIFLSTLSLRRATLTPARMSSRLPISIHALLAESDAVTTLGAGSVRDFYPRSPCGERLVA